MLVSLTLNSILKIALGPVITSTGLCLDQRRTVKKNQWSVSQSILLHASPHTRCQSRSISQFLSLTGLATTFRGDALFPLFLSLPNPPSLNLHRYACLHHAVRPFSPVTINNHLPQPPQSASASPTPRAAPAVGRQRTGTGRCLPVAQLMPCAKCMWYQ
jgi:hypothetical protein